MKNLIVVAFTILATGMTLTIHPALAQDGAGVHEMAESGIVIDFGRTPQDIAAHDAIKIKPDIIWKTNIHNSQKRVKIFEMGESGQVIAFSAPATEFAVEGAENFRLANTRQDKYEKKDANVIVYELAESGITLEFPAERPDIALEEAVAEKFIVEDLKI